MKSFKKRLLISLVIFGGGILLLTLVLFFLNADLNSKLVDIADKKSTLEQRNQTIELLTEAASELDRVASGIKAMQNMVPEEDSLIFFRDEVENIIAKQYNVAATFKFEEKDKDDQQIAQYAFSLAATGSYEDIEDFISALQQHHYILKFSGFSIQKKQDFSYTLSTRGILYMRGAAFPSAI